MIVLFLGLLAGCGGNSASQSKSDEENKQNNQELVAEGQPVVMVDHLGREVTIPENLERILALSRAYMEDLFELGVTPIGKVEEYTNRPEGVALPSISNQENPNLEAIIQLAPDLIIANTRQHAKLLESLEAVGATVFFVDPNKVIQDPLTDRITLFGEMLGLQDVANEYIQRLDQVSQELREKLTKCNYQTGLLLQGGSETILAAQPTGLYGALWQRLGIENVVPAGLPGAGQSTWVNFDLEAIYEADPDVILIRAAGGGKVSNEEMLNFYLENPQWNQLSAIKNGKIFILPGRVNPGNISNEEALKVTAKALCPGK